LLPFRAYAGLKCFGVKHEIVQLKLVRKKKQAVNSRIAWLDIVYVMPDK
jgi:hypothetical protein